MRRARLLREQYSTERLAEYMAAEVQTVFGETNFESGGNGSNLTLPGLRFRLSLPPSGAKGRKTCISSLGPVERRGVWRRTNFLLRGRRCAFWGATRSAWSDSRRRARKWL